MLNATSHSRPIRVAQLYSPSNRCKILIYGGEAMMYLFPPSDAAQSARSARLTRSRYMQHWKTESARSAAVFRYVSKTLNMVDPKNQV